MELKPMQQNHTHLPTASQDNQLSMPAHRGAFRLLILVTMTKLLLFPGLAGQALASAMPETS